MNIFIKILLIGLFVIIVFLFFKTNLKNDVKNKPYPTIENNITKLETFLINSLDSMKKHDPKGYKLFIDSVRIQLQNEERRFDSIVKADKYKKKKKDDFYWIPKLNQ